MGEGATMRKRDLVSGLFWLTFGILFASGGLQHGLMESEGVPGRGALPFIAGVFAIILSLLVLIPALKRKDKGPSECHKAFFPERNGLKRLLIAIGLLAFYGFFLKTLGYPLTTFLFLVGALKLIEPQEWKTTAIFSFLTTTISFAIFKVLHVNFPIGILGF